MESPKGPYAICLKKHKWQIPDPDYFELLHRDYLPSSYIQLDGAVYTFLRLVALIIPVMSLFRLAKFNLDTRQTDSFIGLPTPANRLFFVSFPLIILQAMSPGVGSEALSVWALVPEHT